MSSLTLRREALTDIWKFADLIDFRGGSATFYDLHREMSEFITANQCSDTPVKTLRRRIVLVPREHRKSTVCTVLYILWRIYRNPDIRILIGTNVRELAEEFIGEMKAYLEDEDLISEVWNNRPHIDGPLVPLMTSGATDNYRRKQVYEEDFEDYDYRKTVWTKFKFRVIRSLKAKEATVTAISVGMRPTGKHYDLVILDDIVDLTNSRTPEVAEKVRKWANDLLNVVTKKSEVYEISPGFNEWLGNEIQITGTRYYEHDYYSKFVGNTEAERKELLAYFQYSLFYRNLYRNGIDSTGGYICPEIVDEEVDEGLRRELRLEEYYAQYMNTIVVPEDTVLHSSMVKQIFNGDIIATEHGVAKYYDRSKPDPITRQPTVFLIRLVMCVDLAISQRVGADLSALAVGGWSSLEDNRFFLLDLVAGRFRPSELVDHIYQKADKWNLNSVHVESGVGYQDAFHYTLKEASARGKRRLLCILPDLVRRDQSKHDRIINTLEPIFANSAFYTTENVMRNSPLKSEIDFFVRGRHTKDDCLDVIEKCARKSVPVFRTKDGRVVSSSRHVAINNRFGGCR